MLHSKKMEKYRQIEEMECSSYDLKFYCRDCPAVSFGNYGTWEKKILNVGSNLHLWRTDYQCATF